MKIVILTFLFLIPLSASAATPVPVSQRDKFKSLQTTIAQTQKQKQETEEKARLAENDLKQTKQDLVATGQSMQENEKNLTALEKQITELQAEKNELSEQLHKNRRSIGAMVLGLERIRRIPPEALIAKPGAPLQTAQSVMLLGHVIPRLDKQAADVKASLQKLDTVTAKLETQKQDAADIIDHMAREQDKLKALANKRQQLFTNTHKDLAAQEENLKTYAAQAKTLQDLMTRIEAQSREQAKTKIAAKPATFAKSKAILPIPGNMRLPVTGNILVNYDQPDDFGAPSKGLTISSRPGAVVVAPMGGTVRFAGPFKNYGNMVIVEHKKGLHSLIAGLEKIDTVVGQSVSAGEPLGFVHKPVAGGPVSVYYELRQNGDPVNPAKVFADLG